MTALLWLLVLSSELGKSPKAWLISARGSQQRYISHGLQNNLFNDDFVFDDEINLFEDEHPSDWLTTEFTLLNAPQEPNPSLDAMTVAFTVSRSLQWVDYPTPNAGLERCFNSSTGNAARLSRPARVPTLWIVLWSMACNRQPSNPLWERTV